MQGLTFYKDENSITIDKVVELDKMYFADISFLKGKQRGRALNQPLDKLAIKLLGENYKIQSDRDADYKIEVFKILSYLIK
jgi:hypothetical protein